MPFAGTGENPNTGKMPERKGQSLLNSMEGKVEKRNDSFHDERSEEDKKENTWESHYATQRNVNEKCKFPFDASKFSFLVASFDSPE